MTENAAADRSGRCLCGAIQFVAHGVKQDISACHCGMCRRWASGPLLSASCDELTWEGDGRPAIIQSSDWAERGFCPKCGTALFYRLTAGKYQGATSVALGALDDQQGFTLTKEWFIDKKPDVYEFAGERERLTEAQVFAMFGGG